MTSLGDAVAVAEPIDLERLNERAELQTRSTRKYIVDVPVVAEIMRSFVGDVAVLEIDGERVIDYETVYFDTPDHALYLDTAHRRPRRFKVRTRRYQRGATTMLELKAKNGRGATVKHRREYPAERRHRLNHEARAWIDEIVDFPSTAELAPTLVTRFDRSTVVGRCDGERFTFDSGLVCSAPDGSEIALDGIVVECKSTGESSSVDRWLWRQGIRPVAMSKYCTGRAAIDPDLPANHWHRTLRSHFTA